MLLTAVFETIVNYLIFLLQLNEKYGKMYMYIYIEPKGLINKSINKKSYCHMAQEDFL